MRLGVIQPMEEIGQIWENLLMGLPLPEVAVSSGSACNSASLEPSYVEKRALGVDEDMAHTSIRFGIGRFNTEEEINMIVELVVRQVERLSPLWEMVQENIDDIKKIQWSQHGSEPTLANGLGKH
ncbi:hypothetical protein QQ045_007069 [Rhodiola kirilowii]